MTSIDGYTQDTFRNYLHDIGQFPILTTAEEYSLIERIRQGDRAAYDYFVSCNLKLVVSIAKKHAREDVPIMDLISVGNEGLLKAVEKFDHTKGLKFSTHAFWWIRQAIGRLLRQKGLIWLPEHTVMKIRAIRKIEEQLGDQATDERIAEVAKISIERLQELRQWSMDTVSFEALTNEDTRDEDPLYLASTMRDDAQTEKHQRLAEQHELAAEVEKALEKLNTREREIVKLRYGIESDGDKHSLSEVSREYGVTRQRISQLEFVALGKLQPLLADVAKRMGAMA